MKRFLRAEVVSAVLLVSAGAAFAQKPFADVPRGHWAYDCVLSMHGRMILWKYPDSAFGGKRAMTRYEFATSVAHTFAGWDRLLKGL
jgi:hypothetical protein